MPLGRSTSGIAWRGPRPWSSWDSCWCSLSSPAGCSGRVMAPPADGRVRLETQRLTALYGRRPRAQLDAAVETALRRAALWDEVKDRLRHSALALSGGQQQRLCVARALAPEPEVLLLDEPTASLDPTGTQRIEELCHELKARYTMVIVTHNLQQAARISDYTAFFYLGDLIELGRTEQLFTKPTKEQTEAYITGRFG